jgi:hypothetical protein
MPTRFAIATGQTGRAHLIFEIIFNQQAPVPGIVRLLYLGVHDQQVLGVVFVDAK